MSFNRISAIIYKQIHDTLKNKIILIQYVMFPCMAFILTLGAQDFGLEHNFFVNMFSCMYVTMTPIVVISATISEDRENGSLQALRMANLKSFEYIIGIGFHVFTLCLLGLSALGFIGNYQGLELLTFISINLMGLIISMMIGSIIGLASPNQNAASGLSVPIMIVISFLPMISMFNTSVRTFSHYLYSQQINDLINKSNDISLQISWIILSFNLFVVGLIYLIVYRLTKQK